jgi:DNA repair exonuclease SbcCD nuclease subunit
VEEAIRRQVDLFVVAGDLFDSRSPGRDSLQTALEGFRRLEEAGIRVVVLPGTHDPDEPDSVWHVAGLEKDFSGLHILLGEGVVERCFADLALTVLARPSSSRSSLENPLSGLEAGEREGYVIGLAHGSLDIGEPAPSQECPIKREEIARSGLSYLALGHWHKPMDASSGEVTAWYCGSPEVLYPKDSGAGKVLLVTLARDGTRVEPLEVGCSKSSSITLLAEDLPDRRAIEEAIGRHSDSDLMLEVRIRGVRHFQCDWGPEALEEIEAEMSSGFLFLRIIDESQTRISQEDLERYPDFTVAGRFVRLMEERIGRAAGEEERRVAEEALQIGLALLQGRGEVLD